MPDLFIVKNIVLKVVKMALPWLQLLIEKDINISQIHQIVEMFCTIFKGKLSDSFTNYNYVGNTKVSVSIKKT